MGYSGLSSPRGIAFNSKGDLFIADTFNSQVKKVDAKTNKISVVVNQNKRMGNGGDGSYAINAELMRPMYLTFDKDDNLYIADSARFVNPETWEDVEVIHNNRIRVVDFSKEKPVIRMFAGTGNSDNLKKDGAPSLQTDIFHPKGMAYGPDGALYFAEQESNLIRKIGIGSPTLKGGEIAVPSQDGSRRYVFDASGRHLRTENALTGALVYSFGYTEFGGFKQLTSITDSFGNTTKIIRDSAGKATSIESPDHHITALEITGNLLSKVTTPKTDEYYTLDYYTEAEGKSGLLKSFTKPNSATSRFYYDSNGRLTADRDAAGKDKTLERLSTEDGYEVVFKTPMERAVSYLTEVDSLNTMIRTETGMDGESSTGKEQEDKSRISIQPDGTKVTTKLGADPLYGMMTPYVKETTIETGTLTSTAKTEVAAKSDSQGRILEKRTVTTITSSDGERTASSTYNGTTLTAVTKSAEGREIVTSLDQYGRVVRLHTAAIEDVVYSYDEKGRIKSVTQGGTTEYSYDLTTGYLSGITTASGTEDEKTVNYTSFDARGRVLVTVLPDESVVSYRYDKNGNITGITPPEQPEHIFAFDILDRNTDYYAPETDSVITRTQYQYNDDSQLERAVKPDGSEIEYKYNPSSGKLESITTPEKGVNYSYYTDNGKKLREITSGTEKIEYTYDGGLLKTETISGTVQGALVYSYNNFMEVTGIKLNNINTSYSYDNDGLLTNAGELTISRNPQNGSITGTTLGNITTAQSYNTFGELSHFESGSHYSYDITKRDKLGRITEKVETVEGITTDYSYTYDIGGRLQSVKKNGVETASYGYDQNGNRTKLNGADIALYDEQDRLISYGSNTYTYTANGDLLTKTNGTGSTTYTHDSFGNMTKVSLPDGRLIEYIVDGKNRRIGKKVNGEIIQKFLYLDQLKPAAELNSDNTIKSLFIYATKANVPEYTIRDGEKYRVVTDHLGSPRLVIKVSDGSIVLKRNYDEFGNIIESTGSFEIPFGFAGGIYDADTKLIRFGARDYDSETGRWNQKEPLGFEGAMNFYVYSHNDPINFLDITGLAEKDCNALKDLIDYERDNGKASTMIEYGPLSDKAMSLNSTYDSVFGPVDVDWMMTSNAWVLGNIAEQQTVYYIMKTAWDITNYFIRNKPITIFEPSNSNAPTVAYWWRFSDMTLAQIFAPDECLSGKKGSKVKSKKR